MSSAVFNFVYFTITGPQVEAWDRAIAPLMGARRAIELNRILITLAFSLMTLC